MNLSFETVASAAKPIAAITLGIVFSALLLKKFKPYFKKQKTKVKGSSKRKASGVIFGKSHGKYICSPEQEEGHIFVNGPSGTGKTSALLIPTLRHWHGTSFTVDISGDISRNVEMENKLEFAPGEEPTPPYDIFYLVNQVESAAEKYELLEQLAFQLMPEVPRNDPVGKFFLEEGRKLLTAALIVYYEDGAGFIEICKLIASTNVQALLEDIVRYDNDVANRYISGFLGANEKNTAGCKQCVDTHIKLFSTNHSVMHALRPPKKGELSINPKLVETHNLFVRIEDSKLELYAPLLSIIVAQMMEYFSNRSNYAKASILFCLDEFASFGKLNITPTLRKLRKKKVRIMVLTQSLADIDLIYGKEERSSMMNNFSYKVVLGAMDTDTQDYFSKLIGQEETVKLSVQKGNTGTSTTQVKEFRPSVRPEELAHLGKHLILISPNGWQKIRKSFYFR